MEIMPADMLLSLWISYVASLVFNLYTEGFDAKKITEILCLSMNTIKTHNRRIFQKLGVSSRKELLVYVNMMKEKGGVSFEFEQ